MTTQHARGAGRRPVVRIAAIAGVFALGATAALSLDSAQSWAAPPTSTSALSRPGEPGTAGSLSPAPVLPFRHPLAPGTAIVTPFSAPRVRWMAGHLGVDFAAGQGQDVRAPGAGVVSFSGTVVDRSLVVIDHGSLGGRRLRSTLEPVAPAVSVGDAVGPGDVIGHVSGSHGSCRPATCLHWGVRLDDEYRNPLVFLGERRLAVLLE